MLVADLAIIWCAVFSSFYLRLGWDDFIAQYIHSFLIMLCTIISPVFYIFIATLRGSHLSFLEPVFFIPFLDSVLNVTGGSYPQKYSNLVPSAVGFVFGFKSIWSPVLASGI